MSGGVGDRSTAATGAEVLATPGGPSSVEVTQNLTSLGESLFDTAVYLRDKKRAVL